MGFFPLMRARLIRLLLGLFAALPLPLNHALGATLGTLLILLPNDLRRTTHANLLRCYPELTSGARRRLAWRSLIETGKTISETGPLWCWKAERAVALVREVRGREILDDALARGGGAIVNTPHLGCWEMAGLWGAAHYPMTTLYRRPRLVELDHMVRDARERLGTEYVPADAAGVRRMYQALKENRLLGMLPDQDPGAGGGSFAPFFGVPAYTMTLLSRLARKTQAPVVFAYCERLSWGRGYRLHFRAAPAAVNSGSMEESVAAVNEGVEACVRALPEQYQWGYKRFKTRPEDVPGR